MVKIEKKSSLVLRGCILICVAVFAIFFLWGYDNPVGDYNAPMGTEAVLYLMYIMTVFTAGLTVWSAINSVKMSIGGKGESLSGVPEGKISITSMAILIASLLIGFVCNLGEEAFTAVDGTVTSAMWVTIVDMFLISIYILMAVAALGLVVNMSGILKKNSVK